MLFENLAVDRLIIHEVYRRLDDKRPVQPTYGDHLLQLDTDAMEVFRDRVIGALGSRSQSVEMAIVQADAASAVQIAQDLLSADDASFVQHSRRFADKLTSVQISRNLPGGVLLVFTGHAGYPARSIVGTIKAETHSGFRRTDDMQLQCFKDLFMTPQTKLYKIGVFLYDGTEPIPALPDGWLATIYDNQMSSINRDAAAQYFYEAFLGCMFPVNSAQLTKKFYQETRQFIRKLNVPEERKSDLFTGLYTYMKVDQSPTVELAAFSNQYLTADLKDDYASFMRQRAFPTNAVPKDTSEVQGYLRRRKLRFSRNIQLTAPPDAFRDLVEVRAIEGEEDEPGRRATWTQITIRDRIRDQE